MSLDLIVYGAVAAGLVFWLRSILGTRHGEERERPNPLSAAAEASDGSPDAHNLGMEEGAQSAADSIRTLAENPTDILFIDNKTAENGLLDIASKQKAFDIHFFLHAVQDVFVLVVEAFARDDRETLKSLLSTDVYNAFEGALEERKKSEEEMETEIHAIRRVEVLEAALKGKMAVITVRFKADETRLHKDKDGKILSGDPDRVTEMRDIWTFGRELKSNDPRWLVFETRSDEDDNDIIPNTD